MGKVYRAVLRGDRLSWNGDRTKGDEPRDVEIKVVDLIRTNLRESTGEAMATALASLAQRGGISSIPDPLAWQREERQDRTLMMPE